MNSLEFIEDEIKILTKRIKELREELDLHWNYNHEDEVIECDCQIEEYEELLKAFQQIKNELEAWNIVSKKLILTWDGPNNASGYYLEYFGDYEYETIKKGKSDKND